MFCLEPSIGWEAAYERKLDLSTLTLAEEISARLLAASAKLIVRTQDETEDRPATLEDIRAVLLPLGLDLVTKDAVDWAVEYPARAAHITRICELNQQIEEALAERAGLLEPTLPVPIEKKEAAE